MGNTHAEEAKTKGSTCALTHKEGKGRQNDTGNDNLKLTRTQKATKLGI